jgi:hypothetical protein
MLMLFYNGNAHAVLYMHFHGTLSGNALPIVALLYILRFL